MFELLFHPNLNLSEAERIAHGQGGKLVWSRGRVRMVKAQAGQKPPIPTKLIVAPRGYSWHGQKIQKDNEGTLVARRQVETLEAAICSA